MFVRMFTLRYHSNTEMTAVSLLVIRTGIVNTCIEEINSTEFLAAGYSPIYLSVLYVCL